MLQALLNGKLSREQENMEDVLTSNVFGFMEYLRTDRELLKFLGKAQHINDTGDIELSQLLPAEPEDIKYDFWPKWSEGDCVPCEPDLVLRIDAKEGENLIVLIEAKYHSGKSSEASEDDENETPPHDQLAREWDNLLHIAESEKESREPILIYLTADFGCPVEAIEDSRKNFERKRSGQAKKLFSCFWLSWRHLKEALHKSTDKVFENLVEAMRKLNLVFYYGITAMPLHEPRHWRFLQQFDWSAVAKCRATSWRFSV